MASLKAIYEVQKKGLTSHLTQTLCCCSNTARTVQPRSSHGSRSKMGHRLFWLLGQIEGTGQCFSQASVPT